MRKTIWVDDTDNDQEAAETVTFGLDGKNYDIDLSKGNANRLRNCLEVFVDNARPAAKLLTEPSKPTRKPHATPTPDAKPARKPHAKKTPTPTPGNGRASAASTAEIRAWAQAKGRKVADRGRVSEETVRAFKQAMGTR